MQKKLAHMAAGTWAMTSVTAGLIDRGLKDYFLETAMLKVYSTEALWTIVNDAFQIHGGAAYFTDRPLERMLRDVWAAIRRPWGGLNTISHFVSEEFRRRVIRPDVPVRAARLQPAANTLGRLIGRFALQVQRQLIRHREEILDRQLVHERIAWAAMDLFASSCVLSRLDAGIPNGDASNSDAAVASLFLRQSARRIRESLRALTDNDDTYLTRFQ